MNTDKCRFKVLGLLAFICVNLWSNLSAADNGPAARKVAAPAKTKASAPAARKEPAPAVRRGPQLSPTKERYKQIQDALASKGYLARSEATGQWTAASMDALKRFQANQNLEATGKINSLSLIALGLGPKHETTPSRKAAP
jgi:hypothetical protein